MALNPADVAEVSRLLDQALALPAEQREAWLAALPAEQRRHLDTLRNMLAQEAELESDRRFSALPTLRSDESEANSGDLVGAYRLIREIGRGGMGSVWLAARADGIFERQVAIKLPRLSSSTDLAKRMTRELQIGALLEHPHIARLYDAGIADNGRPYLVMEWVQGLDLITHARSRNLSRAARLRLMLQVCAAVSHAHSLLVVHLDIKPSNLLVDDSGQVKLLDFGIAKLLEAEPDGATFGSSDERLRAHTPRYAAPEQRRGAVVSTAADIYALGVVLHELLTGTLPVEPSGAAAMLGIDLAMVIRRALREDPTERYSSVERLADDLMRVLEMRPTQAAPTRVQHRAALFVRRHRIALGAGVAAVVMLMAGGALSLHQRAREQAQAERATQARMFLAEVLEDVEPAAGQTAAQVTGAQMLQSALRRARQGFAGQPMLRGQVLTEIGIMLGRLGQPDQAVQVLGEAHTLLQGAAPPDDPGLHIAASQLADALLDNGSPGNVAQAGALVRHVLSECSADLQACAKPRAYAHEVLSRLAALDNDPVTQLREAKLCLQDTERGFGPEHAEVAIALGEVALISRNQGALTEAGALLERALAISRHSPMSAADLGQLRTKSATLQIDLGQYDAARRTLQDLLDTPAAPAQRALQQRQLAVALLGQGLLPQALAAIDAALASALSAPSDWEAVFALPVRARVLAALGQHAAARHDITQALEGLRRLHLPDTGGPALRARRMAGEIALRAGDIDSARNWLDPLPAAHRRPPPASTFAPLDLAQTLDLLGTIERRAGHPQQALARHAEAAALLAAGLPPTHPLRLRNALLSATATWLAGGDPTRAALQAAADRYLVGLPADSAWRHIPDPRAADRAAWEALVI